MKCGDPTCFCAQPARDEPLLVPAELRNASLLPGSATAVESDPPPCPYWFPAPRPLTRKQRLLRAIAGALRRIAAWVES